MFKVCNKIAAFSLSTTSLGGVSFLCSSLFDDSAEYEMLTLGLSSYAASLMMKRQR